VPPRTTLRERNRARTRRQIGDAAVELFARRGIAATTVSRATVFRLFPTKEDMALLWHEELVADLDARLSAADRVDLRQVAAAFSTALVTRGGRARRVAALLTVEPTLQARVAARSADVEDVLARHLEREGHGVASARLTAGMAVGVLGAAARLPADDGAGPLAVSRSIEQAVAFLAARWPSGGDGDRADVSLDH
jgi:AcrR family transcriptional regulator